MKDYSCISFEYGRKIKNWVLALKFTSNIKITQLDQMNRSCYWSNLPPYFIVNQLIALLSTNTTTNVIHLLGFSSLILLLVNSGKKKVNPRHIVLKSNLISLFYQIGMWIFVIINGKHQKKKVWLKRQFIHLHVFQYVTIKYCNFIINFPLHFNLICNG